MYAIAVTRIVLVIASAAIAIAVITVAEMIAIFRKEATMCRTLIYAHVIFST